MNNYESKSFIIISASIIAFVLLGVLTTKSCEPDHKSWNAWERSFEESKKSFEECKIKCHPSKSEYLPVTKTCLCETEIK